MSKPKTTREKYTASDELKLPITDVTAIDVAFMLGISLSVARYLMRSQAIASFKAKGQWRTSRGAVGDYVMAQLEKAKGVRGKPSSSL